MRKHLSVLGLLAGTTLYKLLAVMLAMLPIELLLWLRVYDPRESMLYMTVQASRISWVFIAALCALWAILILPMCQSGSKTGYTCRRLGISEKALFFYLAAYNSVCVFILWAWQLGIMLVFSARFLKDAGAEYVNHQTLMTEFYKSPFLHNLLPLSSWLRWLRQGVLVLVLGTTTALQTYLQRRTGKLSFVCILSFVLVIGNRVSGELDAYIQDIFIFIFGLIGIGIALVMMRLEEGAYDEK